MGARGCRPLNNSAHPRSSRSGQQPASMCVFSSPAPSNNELGVIFPNYEDNMSSWLKKKIYRICRILWKIKWKLYLATITIKILLVFPPGLFLCTYACISEIHLHKLIVKHVDFNYKWMSVYVWIHGCDHNPDLVSSIPAGVPINNPPLNLFFKDLIYF